MGRQAEGWSIRWKRGIAYARFTWAKQRYSIALGTRDEREAAAFAARAYSDVVSGRLRPTVARPGQLLELVDLIAEWIEFKRPTIDQSFVKTIEGYGRRYLNYFTSLDRITEANGASYGHTRLSQVARTTVVRELSYLREFLGWCVQQGSLSTAPLIPKLPPKAKGTPSGTQRRKPVDLSTVEALAIIAKLPKESKTINGRKWPIRDRFAFAFETGLRPETLSSLTVPENWQPGSTCLEIRDEQDKARFGRSVDLTPEALRILRFWAPDSGPIFGGSCFYKAIKTAAKAVLGPVRGKRFAPYDWRHQMAKDLLDRGAPLRGVSYVLGHKRPSTTDKYLAPDRRAGAEALKAGRSS
jgi:integrase